LSSERPLIQKYQKAIGFAMEKFCERSIHTFYTLPTYSFFGIWSALETIAKNNGLYDPQKSGFQIWYALICKKICQIMDNGLDRLIIIKKKNGKYVEFDRRLPLVDHSVTSENESKDDEINYETDTYDGWELVRFFTYQEYWDHTKKTLVMTGTKTKRLETVYYTHTNPLYKNLSVMVGAHASMSIPWVFKAPIINDSYNLDGGIFDNYPLTHCDRKNKDLITHYNNRIFGYLIDDKNTMIEAYEILRELWLVYNGFIEIMNIGYLKDSPEYPNISELFFEIRSEIFKYLYFTDVDLETFLNIESERECVQGFNIRDLEEIYGLLLTENKNIDVDLIEEMRSENEMTDPNMMRRKCDFSEDYDDLMLPGKGIDMILQNLRILDSKHRSSDSLFKIGKRTNLDDIMELAMIHGKAYNELATEINKELLIINSMNRSLHTKSPTICRYETILIHLMSNILSYYELKGNFIKSNESVNPGIFFSQNLKSLYKKMTDFQTLTDGTVNLMNKNSGSNSTQIKNWISGSIQIGLITISKILTQGSGNIDFCEDSVQGTVIGSGTDIGSGSGTDSTLQSQQGKEKSSYQKAYEYFFHTDMTGILFKYMCMVNDRVCNDSFNRMRTIRLNTFQASTLNFNMDQELKARLILEGYSKTLRYFANLLNIMEKTKRTRADAEFLESFEIRYKKMN